ncbi:kelch-like protein 17 [Bactrocera neohumeralis]|uniref:kelch-like protein 17 n=1 Tax=Bactrocera neohumeralis TaxID=98809 RepID=UPI002165C376|nr:kelch-like protein 17 [Bactrocera neohumeralis]XP_050329476.1 kelch-like protein 17 [Bactrocera neohumeralis]
MSSPFSECSSHSPVSMSPRLLTHSCSSDAASTTTVASSEESLNNFMPSPPTDSATSGIYCDGTQSLLDLRTSPIIYSQESLQEAEITLITAPSTDYSLARADLLESEEQCNILRQRVTDYEIKNFMQVCKSPEFFDFDVEHLLRLVEHDELNVSAEADVFWAIRRWYKYDEEARRCHLPDLVACLRLTQLDVDFIYSHINSLPGCELLVNKAVEWLLRPCARGTISLRYTKPRKVLRTEDETYWIVVQTRGDHRFADKCVLRYSKALNEWQKWTDIKLERSNFAIVQLENSIICIGGLGRNTKPINHVNRYNLHTQAWEPMPSMQQRRVYMSVALLDGKIYVIGGQDEKYQALNTVEVFDTVAGRWQNMANMSVRRASTAAAVLDGKLYVIGGFNRAHLRLVERYDPAKNIWTQCAEMNEARGWPGVAVHNGHIYVIGGWFNGAMRTVERYNLSANKWTTICSLNVARGSICGLSMNETLWAVGGYGEGILRDTVEVYDEKNDNWLEEKILPEAGRYVR